MYINAGEKTTCKVPGFACPVFYAETLKLLSCNKRNLTPSIDLIMKKST